MEKRSYKYVKGALLLMGCFDVLQNEQHFNKSDRNFKK